MTHEQDILRVGLAQSYRELARKFAVWLSVELIFAGIFALIIYGACEGWKHVGR